MTSFSCFKYMSLYSAIQFTSVSFLYASASNLGDFQVRCTPNSEALTDGLLILSKFLFIDLILILPIAIFSESLVSTLKPHEILTHPSGLDRAISNYEPQEADGEPRFAKGVDAATRANRYMYLDPTNRLSSCPETVMVP